MVSNDSTKPIKAQKKTKTNKGGQKHELSYEDTLQRDTLAKRLIDSNSNKRTNDTTNKRQRQPDEEEFVSDKLTKKIIKEAREQLFEIDNGEEEEEEEEEDDDDGGYEKEDDEDEGKTKKSKRKKEKSAALLLNNDDDFDDDGDDERRPTTTTNNNNNNNNNAFDGITFEEEDDSDDDKKSLYDPVEHMNKEYEHEEYEDVELDEADEQALNAFMNPFGQQRSLADMIMEKIHDKEAEEQGEEVETMMIKMNNNNSRNNLEEEERKRAMLEDFAPEGIDEKVLTVYRKVGELLKRYTTGKFPKAFKIIPALSNWEEVLWLTRPDTWSPHAMYQATRLFSSNLNEHMAQRFYVLVLLPRVRDDIQEHKRLHHALYQALRKATFKPGAWFKGILLPLCESKTCTLREAVVLSSVLGKTSVPALHSSAVLIKLAELEYAGTTSFFIRVLLDKKYALPYRVLDTLVDSFLKFTHEQRALPVVWHQSLLCFVQRYKHELNKEQKKRLSKLASSHQNHYLISPEIVRELNHNNNPNQNNGTTRGERRMDVNMTGISETKPKQAREYMVKTKSGRTLQVDDFRNMPPIQLRDDDDY